MHSRHLQYYECVNLMRILLSQTIAMNQIIEQRAILTPKLEIIPIDPNYLEYDDWDDECSCSTTPSISSSSGFKSHENDSEDLFEEDTLDEQHNLSSSKHISIANDRSYGKFSKRFVL